MKYYAIKCKTENGFFYFCYQVIYGEKYISITNNKKDAIFYSENELHFAEIELLKHMKRKLIKNYEIENL